MSINILPVEQVVSSGTTLIDNSTIRENYSVEFTQFLNKVNNEITEGQSSVLEAMVGDEAAMHRAILEINEAKSTLNLTVAVRDKLMESYKEIMKMEV
jgi:flagellar hook-basal body complex protein FliE